MVGCISIQPYVDEIYRCYRVLGAEAFCQNFRDIEEWRNNGEISRDDYQYLISLNRRLEKEF